MPKGENNSENNSVQDLRLRTVACYVDCQQRWACASVRKGEGVWGATLRGRAQSVLDTLMHALLRVDVQFACTRIGAGLH